MNVIQKLRARQRDMKTLSELISDSLERAQINGDSYAGAQHLIMSSLEMSDGTTERVFAQFGTSGTAFVAAVGAQEAQALRDLGITPGNLGVEPERTMASSPLEGVGTGKYGKADATYEAAIKLIHEFHNEHEDYRPLVGAHVLAGAASIDRGVASRALAEMGIDRLALVAAARAESALPG